MTGFSAARAVLPFGGIFACAAAQDLGFKGQLRLSIGGVNNDTGLFHRKSDDYTLRPLVLHSTDAINWILTRNNNYTGMSSHILLNRGL